MPEDGVLDPQTQDVMAQLAKLGFLGNGPAIVKTNGLVYQVDGKGQAVLVRDADGNPLQEAPKADTSPTTVHVPGKGTLAYDPNTRQWSMVPGSEETPETAKADTVVEGGDGKKYIVKASPNGPPIGVEIAGIPGTPEKGQVISPGQGLVKPDGTVTVPVAPPASKTAEQIAAESAANVDQSKAATTLANKQAENIQTPAQAQADRIAQIHATYQAQTDAALKLVKDKIAAGIELSEADKIKAEADVQAAAAQRDSDLRKAEAEATFTREQPNKDRAFGIQDTQNAISQQNADTNAVQVENTRINNERQNQLQRDTQAVGVLKDQSAAGERNIESLVKSGIAPSKGSIAMLRNPIEAAFKIMQSQIQDGSLQPNNIPTPLPPQAPRPAGFDPSMSVPAPAPTSGVPY